MNEYGQRQINNFHVGGFSDTFPIPGGAAATLLAAVLYNLPALAQMPEFHFVVNFFKEKETSEDADLFYKFWDDHEFNRFENDGFDISFNDAPDDNLCIPQTSIPLNLRPNSTWHFWFVVLGKGYHKSDQAKNGCNSSNMTFPSAHFKISKKFLCHPDNKFDITKLRSYKEKLEDFEKIVHAKQSSELNIMKAV